MFPSPARSIALAAVVLACAVMTGCSSTRLPPNARLIWSGTVNEPGDQWRNLHPEEPGQVYAVDHQSGEIKGVDTVWSGKQSFSFTLRRGRQYDLYFASSGGAASRPAE